MKDAIADLVSTLRTLTWLKVITEALEPGADKFRLAVLLGDSVNEYATGAIKGQVQEILLRLDTKTSDSLVIVEKMGLIDALLRTDPRRDSNAQTTVCPGWTQIRQDKDGSRFESTITIRTQT